MAPSICLLRGRKCFCKCASKAGHCGSGTWCVITHGKRACIRDINHYWTPAVLMQQEPNQWPVCKLYYSCAAVLVQHGSFTSELVELSLTLATALLESLKNNRQERREEWQEVCQDVCRHLEPSRTTWPSVVKRNSDECLLTTLSVSNNCTPTIAERWQDKVSKLGWNTITVLTKYRYLHVSLRKKLSMRSSNNFVSTSWRVA